MAILIFIICLFLKNFSKFDYQQYVQLFQRSRCVYPFHFCGRLTVAKQSTDGYTTYLPKHNFCLYLYDDSYFVSFE